MHRKTIKVLAYLVLSFSLITCNTPEPVSPIGNVQGYSPVYATAAENSIEFMIARPLQKPGKIYIYGNLLLVNEQQKGIHFFNNSNPASPEPLGFLKIQGNVDIAIKNSVLYVDHISNIVALNIADLNHIMELSREKSWDVYNVPPSDKRYFKCVDPERGEVVGWELADLNNPECFH